MPDLIADLRPQAAPSSDLPLGGATILLVEDSRFACEAIRLMCLRSGARLRRADCLRSAGRHLQCYRPNAVIVDLGLPDGSGLDLIGALARQSPRIPAIIAMSGDDGARDAALSAGADRFLAKPVDSLPAFQRAILPLLTGPAGAAPASGDDRAVTPDRAALRDDLVRAAALLDPQAKGDLAYAAQFLSGLAVSARDHALQGAAEGLLAAHRGGDPRAPLARLGDMVRDRLAAAPGF